MYGVVLASCLDDLADRSKANPLRYLGNMLEDQALVYKIGAQHLSSV